MNSPSQEFRSGDQVSPPDGPASDLRANLLARVGGQEAFERSFNARTHYPEKAAVQALDGAVEYWLRGSAAIAAIEAPAEMIVQWRERFVSKWLAYQSAGARTMNWFITGPARFPVERNRKRMETEMRRYDELMLHVNDAASWARRRIASDERANASAEAQASGAVNTREVGGVRLVENTAIDRVQLIFDGKPAPEIIAELKGRAFRWSPREGAWQRQLTRNGMRAAEAVLKHVRPVDDGTGGDPSPLTNTPSDQSLTSPDLAGGKR